MHLFPTAPALMLLAALACPALADDLRQISGTAVLREPIALPEDAELAVEVRGPLGVLLAEARIPGAAETAFALDVPDVAARVRLALAAPGEGDARSVWTAPAVTVPFGGPVDLGRIVLTLEPPVSYMMRLDCAGREVRVGVAPDAAPDALVLSVDGARLEMTLTAAPDGTKYQLVGDADTWLWNRGAEVTLSLAGAALSCAPWPVQTYEAAGSGDSGNWRLVLTGNQSGFGVMVDFVLERDADTVTGRLPGARWRDGAVRLGDADGGQSVVVTPGACPGGGDMGDLVEVTLGDAVLTGCGGDPAGVALPDPAGAAVLTGTIWVVEDIGGGGVIDASRITLFFGTDGRAAGSAGCNRWNGDFRRDGEGLAFGPTVGTRMACAPALMAQEQAFLLALGQTAEFRLDRTGALVLLDATGTALVLARRDG